MSYPTRPPWPAGLPGPGRLLAAILLVALKASGAGAGDENGVAPQLSPRHQDWLVLVDALLSDEERSYFLDLERDYRRDAFIEEFWKVRDPEPRTVTNELRRSWLERAEVARREFGDLKDARSLLLLFNGEPGRIFLADGREVGRCFFRDEEIEAWFYGASDQALQNFAVLVLRPAFGRERPYEVWFPDEPLRGRQRARLPTTDLRRICDGAMRRRALGEIREEPQYRAFIEDILSLPPPSQEWVATFDSLSAALPRDAETFDAKLDFSFPGRRQNRVAVQGLVSVPRGEAGTLYSQGQGHHLFLLTGEVVKDGALFETFRYRFEMPAVPEDSPRIPLLFQRYLRQGPVEIVLKVEDVYARRWAALQATVHVPPTSELAAHEDEPAPTLFAPWVEANEAASRGETFLRLLPLTDGEVQVGHVRFDTVSRGDIDRVVFSLDDKPLMSKRRAPFSVELDLGSTAASHRLRVVAYDASGKEVAADELLINQGGQRFRVRLIEPRPDRHYEESLSAVVEVQVPDGRELDRLELYLREERVATLYQPPFVQPLLLPDRELSYVRAVAYLEDGNTSEDVAFVNAPDYLEQVEVQYVELYASVVDDRGRPVRGLEAASFTVFEDGARQEIRRCEWVEELPVHVALLLDASASMEDSLDGVTQAALGFVESTILPRDRVALLSFNERTRVDVKFTNAGDEVARALAGLRAEGGTSLYDSLVYALHYFHGVRGQRALLVLSDGKDESSGFDFEGALDVARRAGVTIYVIGLKDAGLDRDSRKVLRRFAQETGGRSFLIDDLGELEDIYATIQEELRSQYLLAYQSTSTKDPSEFRTLEVKLSGARGEVRTIRGYFP